MERSETCADAGPGVRYHDDLPSLSEAEKEALIAYADAHRR